MDLFEIKSDKELNQVRIEREQQKRQEFTFLGMDVAYNPKIIVEENCVYRQALNRKNLIKRLKREWFAV